MTRRRQAGSTHASAAGARSLFEPREIKKLVALMQESGLLEIEIESGGEKVRLVRANHGVAGDPLPDPERSSGRATVDGGGAQPSTERAITAPMVGTFHRAPEPGAPLFAETGDVVDRGQVLCVIEAMKMMNQIEAEFRGRVTQVLVEDGRPVEYGEALFLIEPL